MPQVVQLEGRHEPEWASEPVRQVTVIAHQREIGLGRSRAVARQALRASEASHDACPRGSTCLGQASAIGADGQFRPSAELVRLRARNRRRARLLALPDAFGHVQRRDEAWIQHVALSGHEQVGRGRTPLRHGYHGAAPRRLARPCRVAQTSLGGCGHSRADVPGELVGAEAQVGRLELCDGLLLPPHRLQAEAEEHERGQRHGQHRQGHPGGGAQRHGNDRSIRARRPEHKEGADERPAPAILLCRLPRVSARRPADTARSRPSTARATRRAGRRSPAAREPIHRGHGTRR